METDNTHSVRARLIHSAKGLFARFGYEQTSTATIAREAGTSESQLVRYFGSKSGLLEAIFNDAWSGLNARITEIVGRAEHERAAITQILRLVIEAFGRDHDLAFIFLFEGRRVRGHDIVLSQGFILFYDLIHQLIRRGQASGALRADVSVDAMASALLGCAEGMMRDRMIGERTGQPVSFTDADVEVVFRSVVDSFSG